MGQLAAVIGDIHGCLYTLSALHRELRALYPGIAAYSVGDLADRGLHSKGVVDFCIQHDILTVPGNHEEMLMDAAQYQLGGAGDHNAWNMFTTNGGRETAASYLGPDPAMHTPDNLLRALQGYGHWQWLQQLPPWRQVGALFISHAGLAADGDMDNLRWHRSVLKQLPGQLQVHGHTPKREVKHEPGWYINLDTACVYGNVLTAGVFNVEKGTLRGLVQQPVHPADLPAGSKRRYG